MPELTEAGRHMKKQVPVRFPSFALGFAQGRLFTSLASLRRGRDNNGFPTPTLGGPGHGQLCSAVQSGITAQQRPRNDCSGRALRLYLPRSTFPARKR